MARLTPADYNSLEQSWISPQYADAAGIFRVDSLDGRDRVGRNGGGGGDYSGIVFPYMDPIARQVVAERLRLDHPPIDHAGKPEHKYLSAPGQRNRYYWPLADPAWLTDPALPILITEGEKKYLAAHRAAMEAGQNGKPLFCAIALAGVWCWKGRIGKTVDANGNRIDVMGVIPDFDRVVWTPERKTVVCFDSNVETNPKVRAARDQLLRELAGRGAQPFHVILPQSVKGVDINGLDDFLTAAGLDEFLALYNAALRWDWYSELVRDKKSKIIPGVVNGLIALRYAPELRGLIGYNEFARRPETRRKSPWGSGPGPWDDRDDLLLREWAEKKGIPLTKQNGIDTAMTVAKDEPNRFNPVREYLDGLKWDGVKRLDGWLTLYAGVEPDNDGYVEAIAAAWPISAVARIFEPGCKADHILILEGAQGIGKSRLFAILGGPFFSDNMPEFGTKDAAIHAASYWIIELSELEAMTRARAEVLKAFISRTADQYRPIYEKHTVEAPRHCVFGGSINSGRYLRDETGGRRFWPVACGAMKLVELARDRDQLWAEAVARYQKGEHWWLEDKKLIKAAAGEQEARYEDDAWEPLVEAYLLSHAEVATSELLAAGVCIGKPAGQWTRSDNMRVAGILNRLGWFVAGRPMRNGKRERIYTLGGKKP